MAASGADRTPPPGTPGASLAGDAATFPTDRSAPLDGVAVRLVDDEVATVVAGWWLRRLGAAVLGRQHGGEESGDVADGLRFALGYRRDPTDGVNLSPGDGPPAAGDADVEVWVTAPNGGADGAVWEGAALWARSGLASLTRAVGDDGGLGAPCLPRVPVPQALAGMAVALLVAAEAVAADRGRRAHRTIEVDVLELLGLLPMQPVALEQLRDRAGPATAGAVGEGIGGVVAGADGPLFARAVEPAQWQRLLAMVPGAASLGEGVLEDPTVLRTHAAELDRLLRAWARGLPRMDVVSRGQAARVPLAPLNGPDDVAVDVHLNARAFFGAEGGRSPRLPWLERRGQRAGPGGSRPPDRPGAAGATGAAEATEAPQGRPLAGVRVLDLSWAWAGPFATTLLAELGAEVINVEWLPRPSNLRVQAPIVEGAGPDGSAWWSANQRGKASIGVDLKHPAGRKLVQALAAVSDAAIENFSAGVVDRLGIGFDDLAAGNDTLVYVSMSAYGASGPHAHFLGYGTQLYAASGFGHAARSPSGGPSQMTIPLPDPVSGLVGALALAAHVRLGRSVHLDVSELEATCLTILPDVVPTAVDLRYEVEANEDRWRATLTGDVGRGEDERLAVPIATIGDLLADARLAARGFWQPDRAAALDGSGVRIAGAPWLHDGRRAGPLPAAPALFGDTRAVLARVLGYSTARIEELEAIGAVRATTG